MQAAKKEKLFAALSKLYQTELTHIGDPRIFDPVCDVLDFEPLIFGLIFLGQQKDHCAAGQDHAVEEDHQPQHQVAALTAKTSTCYGALKNAFIMRIFQKPA